MTKYVLVLLEVSLKFTFTENGLGAHSPKCTSQEIGRRAFLLSEDQPIITKSSISAFGESDFQ